MQAQDFGPATSAVGPGWRAPESSLDEAFHAGRILRTHVLRPTWHFVLPADILWLLTATGPGIRARNAHRYRQLGLDEATLTHSRDVLASALAGGLHLTRGQIAELLVAAGIAVDGQRLPYILMDAELSALVCSGPPSGTQHTYSLVRDRAPCALDLSRDAALAELARRYFTSHGPATAKDFASWASLSASDVKLALGAAGSDLRHEEIDGVAFWSADERPSTSVTAYARVANRALGPGLRRVHHGILGDQVRARPSRVVVGRRHTAGRPPRGPAGRPRCRVLAPHAPAG